MGHKQLGSSGSMATCHAAVKALQLPLLSHELEWDSTNA